MRAYRRPTLARGSGSPRRRSLRAARSDERYYRSLDRAVRYRVGELTGPSPTWPGRTGPYRAYQSDELDEAFD